MARSLLEKAPCRKNPLELMINQIINRKILAVWRKHFGLRSDVYAPIFYDDFKPGGILFVGMNPSFNVPVFRGAVRGTKYEKLNPEHFYRWTTVTSSPVNIDTCIEISRRVLATYQGYFKKMEEISRAAGLSYQHADLFVYRQTSQKDFLSLIRDKKRNLNEFAKDQLAIFHDIVADIRPAVIIVPNAFASGILRKEWHDSLRFDDDKGFHWLELNGSSIPIFFSSMLSGQRALDTGSYERLRWHVAQAARKPKPPRLSARIEL
jgi:hypothetical protein